METETETETEIERVVCPYVPSNEYGIICRLCLMSSRSKWSMIMINSRMKFYSYKMDVPV